MELHLDNKLDWSANTDTLYRKGQGRFYFLRRLGSFNICNKLLLMVYKSVMASVLFYAVICWCGNTRKRGAGRLVRLTGSVVGTELESLTLVAVKRTPKRLLSIMDNDHQPLHSTFSKQKSMFNSRLLSLTCSTDRLRRSFVPWAIQLYNATQKGRGVLDLCA